MQTIPKITTETYEDWPYRGDTTVVRAMHKLAPLYIRFGHFDERSLNWSSGEYERGVSVYPAVLVEGTVTPAREWLAEIYDGWELLADRTQYAVTGRVIGEGSDEEPVLALSSVVVRGISSPRLVAGLPIYVPAAK